MIKRSSVLLLAAMLAITPGCANDADMEAKDSAEPDIFSGYPDSGVYYYVVDRRTGVVYLSYDYTHRHSITVMLNPDGTPVTADQIGIDYDSAEKGK